MQIFRSQTLKIGFVILAFVLLSAGVLFLRGDITTAGWILILLGVLLFTLSTFIFNKDRRNEIGSPLSSVLEVISVLLSWINLALTGYVVAKVLRPEISGY